MLELNRPIWRGSRDERSDVSVVDPTNSFRKSRHTTNHYTVLIDNSPHNAHLPKRSKSVIGSTRYHRAKTYADDKDYRFDGLPFAIIPFDGVSIGCTNQDDMWDVRVPMLRNKTVESANMMFIGLGISGDTLKSFKSFADNVAARGRFTDAELQVLRDDNLNERTIDKLSKDFLGYLFEAYAAHELKLYSVTTKTLDRQHDQEVWIGGKFLMVHSDIWRKLRMMTDMIYST